MTQGLVILMALTCSLTDILYTFERWTKDFEQETGFCRKSMVFCYLYELFWEMYCFTKCWWFEKCTKATDETNVPIWLFSDWSASICPN